MIGTLAKDMQDAITTIEIALAFNEGKSKDLVVQRTCSKIQSHYIPAINIVLFHWSNTPNPYNDYVRFIQEADL